MKKLIFSLAATLTLSLTTHAQPVYSNIVGMVKVDAERGKFTQVVSNFLDQESPVTVEDFFGTSLPSRSTIYFWVPGPGGGYQSAVYGTRGWSNGNLEIQRSKGFIISIPSDAPNASYPIIFSGDVVGSVGEPNYSVTLSAGFTLVGSPYPVSIRLSETDFSPVSLDRIHVWNGTAWQTSVYGTRGGWNPDLVIEPGQAFFYESNQLVDKTWALSNPVSE